MSLIFVIVLSLPELVACGCTNWCDVIYLDINTIGSMWSHIQQIGSTDGVSARTVVQYVVCVDVHFRSSVGFMSGQIQVECGTLSLSLNVYVRALSRLL